VKSTVKTSGNRKTATDELTLKEMEIYTEPLPTRGLNENIVFLCGKGGIHSRHRVQATLVFFSVADGVFDPCT
jgi:hypothetical protein